VRNVETVLEAASAATNNVCETVLMLPFEHVPPSQEDCAKKESLRQISIALVNEDVALQVGLVTGWDVCAGLARTLLCLSEEDEIGDQDVTDGMGELINIIGGTVKTHLNDNYPSLKLGLPLISLPDGHQPRTVKVSQQWLSIGEHRLQLTAMMQEHGGRKPTAS
jgi:hypothetical protein